MSTTYYSKMIYGFKFLVADIKKTVKKYDEDTGKAYDKSIFSHKAGFIESVTEPIATTESNPDCFCTGEKINSLEIFQSGYLDQMFLGLSLASVVASYQESYYQEIITKDISIVNEFAKKHNIVAKQFLIMSWG